MSNFKNFGTIKCASFDISKFSITDMIDSKYIKTKMISYPIYNFDKNCSQLIFETDPIKFHQYGIPRLHNIFYKTDKDRNFIKIPYDHEQKACIDLFKVLEKIDNFMISNKKNIFGKSSDKYVYVPLVKKPSSKNDQEYIKSCYCYARLCNDYKTNELTTAVFERDDDKKFSHLLNIKSVTGLTKHFKWRSTARFILMTNKIWIDKKSNNNEIKEYGVSLRCLQIEILSEDTIGYSIKTYIESTYMF